MLFKFFEKTPEKSKSKYPEGMFDFLQEITNAGFDANNAYRKEKGQDPLSREEWMEKIVAMAQKNVDNFDADVKHQEDQIKKLEEQIREGDGKIAYFEQALADDIAMGASQEKIDMIAEAVTDAKEFYDVDTILDSINKSRRLIEKYKEVWEQSKNILAKAGRLKE